jgi:ferredoxin-NADP reductase
MATPRSASLTGTTAVGPDTRLLELEAGEPLGFRGGQYIIVDSGLTLPSGKAAKRAYSILAADGEQRRFRLAVKRIGPCSSYLHALPPGAELRFSGPWGKLFPGEAASGPTLVVATDTGISAALALVLGERFAPLRPHTKFHWLRRDPGYFLPDELVRAALPPGLALSIDVIPPIDHPERLAWVRARVGGERPAQAFVAGDGAVNYALLDDLVALGVPATRDSVESFFNMPKKTA